MISLTLRVETIVNVTIAGLDIELQKMMSFLIPDSQKEHLSGRRRCPIWFQPGCIHAASARSLSGVVCESLLVCWPHKGRGAGSLLFIGNGPDA